MLRDCGDLLSLPFVSVDQAYVRLGIFCAPGMGRLTGESLNGEGSSSQA